MVGEILRVVLDHGTWGLAALLLVLAGRSRPGRELGRCMSTEIRWRYLRRKGIPDAQLRRLLLGDQDHEEP